MIAFILGAFGGSFLILALLQLATKKTINFAGITDRSEDPERFRNFVLVYLTGFLGIAVLFLFWLTYQPA